MDELNNSEIKKLYDCDYRLKGEYNLEFSLEKFIFELPRYTLEFFLTKLLANFFNQFLALLKWKHRFPS